MAEPVKRVHYFDHQFLRADDFTAEQAYHQSLRRLHNRLLHTWGIAEGLEVTFQGGASSVTVSPGVAIDSAGREIVVTEDTPVELLNQPADSDVYVTISYSEEETDSTQETGAEGNMRFSEVPQLGALRNAPSDPGTRLVLAKATRKGTEVTAVDDGDRRVAGAAGGLLDVLGLGLRDPGIAIAGWVRFRLEAAGRANVSGSLSVNGGLSVGAVATPDAGNVALAGNIGTRGISPVPTHNGWAGGIHTYDIEAEASIWARSAIFVDGTLSVGTMRTNAAKLEVAGHLLVSGNQPLSLQRSVVRLGTTDGSAAVADEVVGAIGFLGNTIRHGQLAYRPTRGFELVDMSNTTARLDYAWDTRGYAALKVGSLMIGGANSGAPGRLLHVENSEILSTGPGGGLSFGDRGVAGMNDSAAGNRWVLYSNAKIARMWTPGSGDVLTIDATGNVGIGVADAGARLQVGGGAIMPAAGNSAAAGIQFPSDPGGGAGDEAYLRYFAETGETTKLMLGVGNDADDRIGFWQFGAERMTLYNGMVGVGITSPVNQLSVIGPTGIRQNRLYLSGGTDASPWSSLTYNAYHNANNNGWVFPDTAKTAVTVEIDSTGANGIGRFQVWGTLRTNTQAWVNMLDLNCETGDMNIRGALRAGGGKAGYVTDQFVNAHGDALEQGDVVVLGGKDAALTYGVNDNIPIPEADMAEEAYDTRVCGIVAEVHGEVTRRAEKETAPGMEAPKRKRAGGGSRAEPRPRAFSSEELDELKSTEVKPGQIGMMVTLGAYAHCKVDAKYGAIEVGDLLTTSPTKGHAQKVLEPEKAVGAIIGKALASRERGRGKIPVMVLLQ